MAYGGPIYFLGMECGCWDNFDVSTTYTPPSPRAWWNMPYFREFCEYSENTWKRKLFRFVIHIPFMIPVYVLKIIYGIVLLIYLIISSIISLIYKLISQIF